MTVPAWADATLSAELTMLASAGENQNVEFKREFPKQVSDLAKEIAGFATSNDGAIFIGVTDEGEVAGIEGGMDAQVRQACVQRVEGLCANSVKPSITPKISFAVVDEKVIMAVAVPKGAQPIYYSGAIPYLRQVTAARPMSPDEVIEKVQAWLSDAEPSPVATFLGALATFLVEAHILVAERRVRLIDPWHSEVKYRLGFAADRARELSAHAPNELQEVIPLLQSLADACETVANERATLGGSRAEVMQALDDADVLTAKIRARWIDGRFSAPEAERQIERLRVSTRMLADFVVRIDANPDHQRLDTLQGQGRDRGYELLEIATLGVGIRDEATRNALWDIGVTLRELQTRKLYADGSLSYSEILDGFRSANQQLQDLLRVHDAVDAEAAQQLHL